jgi:hypothetical protein
MNPASSNADAGHEYGAKTKALGFRFQWIIFD